jgi:hypothetical protein
MRDDLVTVLEALRRAQAELASYLDSADRNAELTIAKLVGILDRRDVVGAARLSNPGRPTFPARPPLRPRNVSSRERVERSDAALAAGSAPRIRTTATRGGLAAPRPLFRPRLLEPASRLDPSSGAAGLHRFD